VEVLVRLSSLAQELEDDLLTVVILVPMAYVWEVVVAVAGVVLEPLERLEFAAAVGGQDAHCLAPRTAAAEEKVHDDPRPNCALGTR
jgi:hypothetical protein